MRTLIATPLDGDTRTGMVCAGYHTAVGELRAMGCGVVPFSLLFGRDQVRSRARATHYALTRDDWDYLLWIDSDTVFDPNIVPPMLERAASREHHVLGAPYPRKVPGPPTMCYRPTQESINAGGLKIKDDCAEIEGIGFGFMLTSRHCLERMVTHYREETWFSFVHPDGAIDEVAGIFNHVFTSPMQVNGQRYREMHSEDYSFCDRWRAIGGRVQMYVGAGVLGHVGLNQFKGEFADIGRTR